MGNCHIVVTSMDKKVCLEPFTGKATEDNILWYKSVVRLLIWLVVSTWVEIAYAVSILSRFMVNPGPVYKTAAQRVLRWLTGTVDLLVHYSKDADGGSLASFTDAVNIGLQSIEADCRAILPGEYTHPFVTYGYPWDNLYCYFFWLVPAWSSYIAIEFTNYILAFIKKTHIKLNKININK